MSIDAHSLKEQVIKPTLKYLNEVSPALIKLLLGTAAVETQLKPLGIYGENNVVGGIGLYNITQQQHLDIWDNYLAFDQILPARLEG